MRIRENGLLRSAIASLVLALAATGAVPEARGGGREPALHAGPMLGYSQMREVAIWVQTRAAASVQIAYWKAADKSTRIRSAAVQTDADTVFTATIVVGDLEPGTAYDYEVVVDGVPISLPYPTRFRTQMLWQWRTDPPPFTMAIASCFYVNEPPYDRPGEPYGAGFQILDHLTAAQPDAMLWLGDNTYLREVDWHSRSGILHRYSHTRAYSGLQPLLASTHHYAIWDDHDFGPNDSDRSFWGKDLSLEAFRLFWPNPSHGVPGIGGITTYFEWADSLFVMLDNRYYRTPDDRVTGERTMLGRAQLRWLIDVLASSSAPFKFVAMGGQFLNPYDGFETYATFAEERERILRTLAMEDIPGVIFLSGDRHRTELSRLARADDYPLYDVTISPLTAGPATGRIELNPLRVEGTLVQQRNFALLHVEGPRTDRVLTIRVIDQNGSERWSRQIAARDLRR